MSLSSQSREDGSAADDILRGEERPVRTAGLPSVPPFHSRAQGFHEPTPPRIPEGPYPYEMQGRSLSPLTGQSAGSQMLLPHPSEPYGALSEVEDEAERGMCMAWMGRSSAPASTRDDTQQQIEAQDNLCVVCYSRVSV